MYDGLEADGRLSEFHLDLNLRKNHRFLTDHCQTSQTHIDKFQQLKAGFKLLGFQDGEVDTVYRILAAILHLGDIEFGEVASEDNTDNKSHVIHVEPLRTGENVSPFSFSFFFFLLPCMQIEFLESDKIKSSRSWALKISNKVTFKQKIISILCINDEIKISTLSNIFLPFHFRLLLLYLEIIQILLYSRNFDNLNSTIPDPRISTIFQNRRNPLKDSTLYT